MTITGNLTTATHLHCIPSIVLPVMLLLDYQNALIQSLLTERFSGYDSFLPPALPSRALYTHTPEAGTRLTS